MWNARTHISPHNSRTVCKVLHNKVIRWGEKSNKEFWLQNVLPCLINNTNLVRLFDHAQVPVELEIPCWKLHVILSEIRAVSYILFTRSSLNRFYGQFFWYFIAYRDKNLEENFKSIKQRRLFLSVKERKFNSKCVKKGNSRSLWTRVNVTVTLEHDYYFFTKMGIFAYVKQ